MTAASTSLVQKLQYNTKACQTLVAGGQYSGGAAGGTSESGSE